MSYVRVLPRDLFNEANLLKCYGQVVLMLERISPVCKAWMVDHCDEFEILQEEDSGAIFIANLPLMVNGEQHVLWRPLNSKEPWPLYVGDDVPVFDDKGRFTKEFIEFIS